MKSLLSAIATVVTAYLPSKQIDMGCIGGGDFKQEHPSVVKARAEAKEKMKQWGRKTVLEGGAFSRNHTVLRAERKTMN
jgi:hypothetical protein